MPLVALAKLKAWVSDPSFSVLFAQGQGVKTSSLDFAVDFLEAVQERNYPVVWALRSNLEPGRPAPLLISILRSLISQVLDQDISSSPGSGGHHLSRLTLASFKRVATIRQWLDVFEKCVSVVSRLFIVIDMATIEDAVCNGDHDETNGEYFLAYDFWEHLSAMVDRRGQGVLKVMVIAWRMDPANVFPSLDTDVLNDMRIFTDMGHKVQRLMRQPKYRAFYKKRQKQTGHKFKSTFDQDSRE